MVYGLNSSRGQVIEMIEEGTPEDYLLKTTNLYIEKANTYLEQFTKEMEVCNVVEALHVYKNTNFYIEKAKDYAGELTKMGEEDVGMKKWREAHDIEDKGVDIAVTYGMDCECKRIGD